MFEFIMSIINGISSISASNDYSNQLGEIKENQKVSEATKEGESIYQQMSHYGLPGYESEMSEIDTQIPTTLNQIKDYVSSGSMVDAISSLSANVAKQKRQLSAANEAALLENKRNYANYLGGVSGPQEMGVQDKQTQLAIAQAYEKLLGKQSGMTWANTGVGGLEKGISDIFSTPGISQYISSLLSKDKTNMNPSLSFTSPEPGAGFTNSIFGGDWLSEY
jgi:hypothetical protein